MAEKLLTQQQIHALHTAALDAGLVESRRALLTTLDASFVALLPKSEVPSEQLLTDLSNLCVTLGDDSIPIVSWLKNALLFTHTPAERAVFQEILGEIHETMRTRAEARRLDPEPHTPAPAPRPVDTRFAEYLDKIEADVALALGGMPKVRESLAMSLEVPRDRVAHELLHRRSGKEMVMALSTVDEDLKNDATRIAERGSLKGILLQLVPAASDWRSYAVDGRARLAAGEKFIELPLSNHTVAEAVLAGIACRACQFVSDTPRGPSGAALLRMPAISAFFIDPTQDRLVAATVGLVAMHRLNLSPDAPELRHTERLRRQVNEVLLHDQEAVGEARCPRWLLLDDDALAQDGKSGEPEPKRVAMAVAALGDKLPHLRILSLGDGADGELTYALHIGDMWRKQL